MKKVVEVTITKSFEIDIPDEILGPDAVDLFSTHIFDIDTTDEIFEHAAYNIINENVGYTIDYIGLLGKYGVKYNGEAAQTTYKELDSYEDYEVK